jgi:K+-sensing histidine kinase KdpD
MTKSLLQFRSDIAEGLPEKGEEQLQRAQSRLAETLLGLRRIRDLVLKLRIADGIVKKHDGTLTLLDGPGGGTLAAIRIPLRRTPSP